MKAKRTITIIANDHYRQEEVTIYVNSILYVKMKRNYAMIHVASGKIYQTRMKFSELEEQLGDGFVRLNRGCLVSAMAIHSITKQINLCNGESLDYVTQRKKEIIDNIQTKQEEIIRGFKEEEIASEHSEYHEYYKVFDDMPFAFTDIEMVFSRECRAVDWIFRYGNHALAELERVPLSEILGNSFRTLFPNMDDKWLRNYERAALYGETLRIIDYSPEIDTCLDVICFPTFPGHCGCILFDVSQINFHREGTPTEKAMAAFIDKLLRGC